MNNIQPDEIEYIDNIKSDEVGYIKVFDLIKCPICEYIIDKMCGGCLTYKCKCGIEFYICDDKIQICHNPKCYD